MILVMRAHCNGKSTFLTLLKRLLNKLNDHQRLRTPARADEGGMAWSCNVRDRLPFT